jgi:succinate-semialdehyde dehydrogenase/glutarate-semialdehyde dehydrogenase
MASELRGQTPFLAECLSAEMGKSVAAATAEISKSISALEWYAENGPALLHPQEIHSKAYKKLQLSYEPLGILLAVMPWNYPVWQFIRVAAPNLLLGNVLALKHSEIVAGTAEILVNVMAKVSPIVENFVVPIAKVHEMISDSRIRGVTLTGSVQAGRSVAETAGRNLKKCVLELGGSDAYLVFASAKLDKAVKICMDVRLVNEGQSCIAGKRFLVEEGVFASFCDELKTRLGEFKHMPVLAHERFSGQLQQQVDKLMELGANVVFQQGSFHAGRAEFPIMVLDCRGLKNETFFIHEEIFGPVFCLFSFKDEKQAVRMANMTAFGLGSGVISEDLEQAHRIAAKIQAGMVAINDYVRSDVTTPFGGMKDSGFGRELGEIGLTEFANLRWIGS